MIHDSVLGLIGGTPMVRLRRLPAPGSAEVVAKIEVRNPAGSVKDRIALAMVQAAEQAGQLGPDSTIVEPTSGNTGIGLALVAAARGYRIILVMPDDASEERRALLRHLGAEVVLTPARELMKGAIDRAAAIVAENPNCFMPEQFRNPANPEAHRRTTVEEILADCGGSLDAFVVGVGTGGTLTGVGEVLKQRLPHVQVVAVEPERSPALSGGRPPAPPPEQGVGGRRLGGGGKPGGVGSAGAPGGGLGGTGGGCVSQAARSRGHRALPDIRNALRVIPNA
ncbi:MAG: pyridoxal-phosphate dependent enzyme, partial [Spirochaetaceae bacterium]|nr:pyridoxal-phosphate dependent enzyme [Spirochaetaceae bacterium]